MQVGFPIPRRPVVDLRFIRRKRVPGPGILALPDLRFTTSGRAALGLALGHCGVSPGDRVLVPTYHCPTMIAPVVRTGASLAWYPLTSDGRPDMDFLKGMDTAGVRAMLAAHYFGFWGPMDDVARYCCERDIALIEDGAHCLFAPLGRSDDACHHYVIGSLTKFLPVAKGGILATSAERPTITRTEHASARETLKAAWDVADLAASAGRLGPPGAVIRAVSRMRRRSATTSTAAASNGGTDIIEDWLSDTLLDDGALSPTDRWLVEHSAYDELSRARHAAFARLSESLRNFRGLRPLRSDAGLAAPYVFPVQIEDAELAYQSMRSKGLPVFRWDLRWPGTPVLDRDVGPEWSRTVVQIACHQSLDEHQITHVVDVVRRSIAGAGPQRR